MPDDPVPDTGVLMAAAAAQHRAGRTAEAVATLRRICEVDPGDALAHTRLGRLLLGQGEARAAAAALERATQLAPADVTAVLHLGAAYDALRRVPAAEACYRRALELDPGNDGALNRLRNLLITQERHTEVLAMADAALARGRDTGEVHMSRGAALFALAHYDDAVAAFEAAMERGALRGEALSRIASARMRQGRAAEAEAAFDEAVALHPNDPLTHLRRAVFRLLHCNFADGWRDYEHRWDNPAFVTDAGACPAHLRARFHRDLSLEVVRGRRVLAVGEQGIGDQVMFASMLPDLARDAASVTCVCEPRLVRLFASSFPDLQVAPMTAPPDPEDFEVIAAVGSLGRLYRHRLEDFPGTPYLAPSEAVRRRWAERLGPRPPGLRIGISWRGGTARTRTSERSVPLDALAPVLDLPGCEIVSLQYGDPAAEIAAVNAGRPRPIRGFPAAEIDDFEELAGLVAGLDVVVSVQTSLVHLTGAIGVPALVLIPQAPEWRYTAGRDVMPWYGSVRLFRQDSPGDWTSVIARVCEALQDRLAA